MIDLAVLGLLTQDDLHGYELKKRIVELMGAGGTVSFGSLYPALARLERGGLIRVLDRARTRPASPMTGAITGELAAFRRHRLAERAERAERAAADGDRPTRRTEKRNRKVYGITERGIAHLHELLATSDPADDRTFSLQVAFCSYLAPAERLQLFERRRGLLQTLVAERSRAADHPTDPYRRSLQERDTEQLHRALAWLDELVALTGPPADVESGGAATLTGGSPR